LLMRSNLLALAAIAGSALSGSACSVPPFKGNDTGGIIAWSPETHQLRHQLAAQHCADYDGKTYQITSVRARYGERPAIPEFKDARTEQPLLKLMDLRARRCGREHPGDSSAR
jgi:hypothetical protein